MKKWSYLLVAFLVFKSATAAVPTVEGLFRNGANADLTGDTVALSFVIEKLNDDSVEQQEAVASMKEEVIDEGPLYVKVIFSVVEGEPVRALQVLYSGAQMEDRQVADVFSSNNIMEHTRLDSPIERKLLYALLIKYGLNRAEGFNSLLKRVSPDFKTNSELINREKRNLYTRYMDYLKQRNERAKSDGVVEGELVSPLKPEDEEEREKVLETLRENFLVDDGKVKLIREKGRFFWEMELENVYGKFSHENHRLRKLLLKTIDGELHVSMGEYIMFNGVHDLPKTMLWKLPNGNEYRLTFTVHQDFTSRSKSFAQRVQDYQKLRANTQNVVNSRLRGLFIY